MKAKYLISFFVLIIFILVGYWIKCQTSANLSESVSLRNFIPFKYLQRNDVIPTPTPGIIFKDSFESRITMSNQSKPWVREEGMVTLSHDLNGVNNSRCLLINNRSRKSWSSSHIKFVEVQKGDIFSFKVFVKLHGDNISAYASIASFDKNKKAIDWNYITEKVANTEKWIKIENKFMVTDGIDYIRFKLSGNGIGEFKFDDINFRKES